MPRMPEMRNEYEILIGMETDMMGEHKGRKSVNLVVTSAWSHLSRRDKTQHELHQDETAPLTLASVGTQGKPKVLCPKTNT
jgi:hypothetical protein